MGTNEKNGEIQEDSSNYEQIKIKIGQVQKPIKKRGLKFYILYILLFVLFVMNAYGLLERIKYKYDYDELTDY